MTLESRLAREAPAFPVGAGPVIVLNTTVVLLPVKPGETVSAAPLVDDRGVRVVVTGSVTMMMLKRLLLALAVAVVCVVVAGAGVGTGVGLGSCVLFFMLVDVPEMGEIRRDRQWSGNVWRYRLKIQIAPNRICSSQLRVPSTMRALMDLH